MRYIKYLDMHANILCACSCEGSPFCCNQSTGTVVYMYWPRGINDKSILIVLNHNRCLYVVSQRWLLLLEKDFDKIDKKKNLLDTADDG